MTAKVLNAEEQLRFVPVKDALVICFNVWLTEVSRDGKYVPDFPARQGITRLIDLIKQPPSPWSKPIYILVAGGHPELSNGESIASVYARAFESAFTSLVPDVDISIFEQPKSAHMAASTAGEIHFFRATLERLKKLGCEGHGVVMCGWSHMKQVRTLMEHNGLGDDFNYLAYPTNRASGLYFRITDLLLAVDKSGKLLEALAHLMGATKTVLTTWMLNPDV